MKVDRLVFLFVILALPLIAPLVLWSAAVAFGERLAQRCRRSGGG
jgi:hypothetical protein